MRTFAYIRDDASWRKDAWLNFSDLIGMKEPSFIFVQEGDLILAMEPIGRHVLLQEWLLRRVFRVSRAEETGDALDFELQVDRVLFEAGGASRHTVSRQELLEAHSWVPDPAEFFKACPRSVWVWLCDVKGVPLPQE